MMLLMSVSSTRLYAYSKGLVTSASYAFRSTVSTIGIAMASAVFQNVLNTQLWKQLGKFRPGADVFIPRVRKESVCCQRLALTMEGGR